jgi:putative methyltransferase (TIGR04325 family)
VIEAARAAGRQLGRTKGAQAVRKALKWRQFRNSFRFHWGVYSTFAEAIAAAPPGKPIGFDHEGPAQMFRNLMTRLDTKDYAVLHWLERGLPPGGRVFDFGGHVGVKFYAYRTIGAIPSPIDWTVYDVPAVTRAGRDLALEHKATELHFTDNFEDASGADVFLALGSLQFVEAPLDDWLRRLAVLPRTVIVSSTPMVAGPRYVTLQNAGTNFCPYLIEDERAVLGGMERLGYVLRHRWQNLEKSCLILDQPERSVEGYTSLHFERV